MKKIVILALSLTVGSTLSFGQEAGGGKLKKAESSFSQFSFDKAIDRYEDLDLATIDQKRNLATSYWKTNQLGEAENLYKEIVTTDGHTANDVYNYASILRENKNYTSSDDWMAKFNQMNVSDSRGKAYATSKGAYKQLQKDKGQFKLNNLDVNSEQQDFGTAFYKDQVVFASSREGFKSIIRRWNWNKLPFLDTYIADKDGAQLTNPNRFSKKVNKKFHEGPVAFNAQGNKMIFTRNNYKEKAADKVIRLKLFSSELVDGSWTKPAPLPYNSPNYSVGHASISKDGKWLYFASDMPGGFGGVDIYKAEINADGSYGKAINMGDKINTEGNEMFPFIHPSNEMLFFSSNGKVGLGGLDVFVAQIKEDASIGKVLNAGAPLNSNRDDFAFILSEDQKMGYLSSNRDGGKGDDDIYSVDMLKPFTFGKTIKGVAKDKKGQILAGTVIQLFDADGNVVETVTTTDNGEYAFLVPADKEWKLDGEKEDYFPGKNTASTATEDDVIIANLELEKDPGLSLYALVTDKKTKAALNGVTITLLDNMTGKTETFITPATGDYMKPLADKKLNDRGSWNLTLQKEGYFTKTVTYNTELDHEGQYDVHANLDLSLDPEVKDLSEMIQINPINFDLNKYNIRPDAATELDKIVKVMNQYPGLVIELGAHTDCRGSKKYNERLSDKRAKASAKYIAEKITNPERIYGKGYGEERLLNGCACEGKVKSDCDEETHSENRRTEFKVIKTGNDALKVTNSSTDSFDE